jgi:hypothetical protein
MGVPARAFLAAKPTRRLNLHCDDSESHGRDARATTSFSNGWLRGFVQLGVKAFCVLILWCLVSAGSSFAQTNTPPALDDSTNQLSVTLWLPREGEPVHAPATIHLFARVLSQMPAQKGDVAKVDFFADAKRLGSGTAFWHEGFRPDMHSNRPQPMIVSRPGFSIASMVWTNAPAGIYALTARATVTGGVTAVSPPVNITVQP